MALAPLRSSDPMSCGPYQLQGRLGSGGMGVVYLAFGPDSAPVALKVLQPALAHDEEYRVRFIREVSAARLVDSPYVARVMAAETELRAAVDGHRVRRRGDAGTCGGVERPGSG